MARPALARPRGDRCGPRADPCVRTDPSGEKRSIRSPLVFAGPLADILAQATTKEHDGLTILRDVWCAIGCRIQSCYPPQRVTQFSLQGHRSPEPPRRVWTFSAP